MKNEFKLLLLADFIIFFLKKCTHFVDRDINYCIIMLNI